MKKIQLSLMLICLATGIHAQIAVRQPVSGNYKPVLNKTIVTSFLGDREKLQLLQASPSKPEGMANMTSLGTKSTIGICTSDNAYMTSSARHVEYVDKSRMMISNMGWLCLEVGGVEKGYYAIEVNLYKEGIKEFNISFNELFVPAADMLKISALNNKLVFMRELQGGVVNKIFIHAVNKDIQDAFYFSNAQVSKVNL